jgi:hypothetical protein
MPNNKPKRLIAVALILSGLVSGCAATPEPAAAPKVSKAPEFNFYPTGSASSNLTVFENVMEVSGAGKPIHDISKSIELLVETGFDIEVITHTAVESKIGASVDSVSLAVAFGGECLIAQFSTSWLTTTVAGELASGCLIGDVEKPSLVTN